MRGLFSFNIFINEPEEQLANEWWMMLNWEVLRTSIRADKHKEVHRDQSQEQKENNGTNSLSLQKKRKNQAAHSKERSRGLKRPAHLFRWDESTALEKITQSTEECKTVGGLKTRINGKASRHSINYMEMPSKAQSRIHLYWRWHTSPQLSSQMG